MRFALAPALAVAIASTALMACAPALPKPGAAQPTSGSSFTAWNPPDDVESEMAPVPADLAAAPVQQPAAGTVISLPQAVDTALRNDPDTRSTWLRAHAAAAQLGSERSSYYPRVDVGVEGAYTHSTQVRASSGAAGGGGKFANSTGTVTPYVRLSYLLFDFGARASLTDASLQGVLAANWNHNAALQDTVLRVTNAYYRLVSAKALVEAAEANVQQAQLSLRAATDRHKAGTAGLGDVLQAQTALAGARLSRQAAMGQTAVLAGQLANAMGVNTNAAIDVPALPDDLDARAATESVHQVLQRALQSRPDLMALRASAAQSWQQARAAKRNRLPTLSLDANANRVFYLYSSNPIDANYGDNYSAGLTLNFPLFTGFENSYNEQRASYLALAAEADARALERQIALDVWTAYQQLETNAQQVDEARVLVEAAEQWEKLERGRYEAGVGTILDLMTAQTSLASSRARSIQARADWLLAFVGLAHAAGDLGRQHVQQLDRALQRSTGNASPPVAPMPASTEPSHTPEPVPSR